jgi:hypothetical protein
MKAERDRLKRLHRLERMRAIAKQTAAAEAAQAEGTLTQLDKLAERTRAMAADYASRLGMQDGDALRQMSTFARGLYGISRNTANDAENARRLADVKMQALNEAERRRAVVEDRVERQTRVIAKGSETPILGSRKKIGTGLE